MGKLGVFSPITEGGLRLNSRFGYDFGRHAGPMTSKKKKKKKKTYSAALFFFGIYHLRKTGSHA